MATRPVFVPRKEGCKIISEVMVDFKWNSGMATSQKRKNICDLHEAAKSYGLDRLLEISSKSEFLIGRKLSAFNLPLKIEDQTIFLECAYQGSKVFQHGGPFKDLFTVSPREAKNDKRLRNSGYLIGIEFMGKCYPLSPKNAFYDWLYFRALLPHQHWISENISYDGYTDIEFNPLKSINCQARAFAEWMSLLERGEIEKVVNDFDYFSSLLDPI